MTFDQVAATHPFWSAFLLSCFTDGPANGIAVFIIAWCLFASMGG